MSNTCKFYVTKTKSEKTGKEYFSLLIDFGYRTQNAFLDTALLAELVNKSFSDLYSMKVGDKIQVKVGD